MSPHVSTLQYLLWWCAPVKKLMEIYCFCWLHPQQLLLSKKEEWDWPTSCSHCCSPPCQRWPPRKCPRSAPSSSGRWSEAHTCRLLSGSPSTTVLVGFDTLMLKDIWWYFFGPQVVATAVWTWTTRPILALKTWSTSWRRFTRTRDTQVWSQGEHWYRSILFDTKQGGLLGACWHRCRWQGHRERQRGLRLRRLRCSRLWSHFPMGTSSRCSGHKRF